MSKNETGLMKKTKKELVEIIIRNDDVREDLNQQINVYKNKYAEKVSECEKLDVENEKLFSSLNEANKNVVQHQASIDELTSQKAEAEEVAKCFKNERDCARNWNYVLGIAVIVITACWIIF